jgi:3D-(3,5/4)-trihydroxycyclohexane-1,2-dione acylhydrolase (decyclizing)
LAAEADLILGVGTRWADFTTASRTAFQDAGVRFVNVNVTAYDAHKQAGLPLVGDARVTLEALTAALAGHRADEAWTARAAALAARWDAEVSRVYAAGNGDRPTQAQVLGAVNAALGPRDVVVNAAGSMPGDLHKLWRTRDPKGYHLEYGYSCMGYEVAGGLGVKLADPTREVVVLVGDGSWLMMPSELVTALQEGVKLVVVLVDNGGYASIGALSRSLGSGGFGTQARYADAGPRRGEPLGVDLAANAESLGARVVRARSAEDVRRALDEALAGTETTVVAVTTDPTVGVPSYAWWDVPVAEVSTMPEVRAARAAADEARTRQRVHLAPPGADRERHA